MAQQMLVVASAGIDRGKVAFEIGKAIHAPRVTHLCYAVKRAASES